MPSVAALPVDLVVDLALPYDAALAAMAAAHARAVEGGRGTLFVVSHSDEVVTLGRHAPEADVFAGPIAARGALVRRIERGGGATAHGPGQLVVYPVLSLAAAGLDVKRLSEALLGAAVDLAADVGVAATATLDPAGVYVDGAKLASLGFRVASGVVTHGLALNVLNDLTLFSLIVPCGVAQQRMVRLSDRTGHRSEPLDLHDLAERLASHVARRCVLALSGEPGIAVTRPVKREGPTNR